MTVLAFSFGLTLLSAYLAPTAQAGEVGFGGACNITSNRLSPDTKQYISDCTATTYCAANGTCAHKECRRDEFPFGYRQYSRTIPDRCDKGFFCPDEMDSCQPVMEVGSLCQLNRDDQCAPPPNAKELAGPDNFNGALCLNYQCMYANASLGNPCVVENTAYVGFEAGTGKQYINVVSRGNCVNGLYCDAVDLTCYKQLEQGEKCVADKQCITDNCTVAGICGIETNSPKRVSIIIYIIVGVAIITIMLGTLIGLYILHKRHRAEEREKRAQYWREQETFRQNIMQMREQARTSLLSLPWQSQPASPRGTSHALDRDYPPSENSQSAMLHAASQPSGLRNQFSDPNVYDDDRDGSGEESLVMRAAPRGQGGQGARRMQPNRRV